MASCSMNRLDSTSIIVSGSVDLPTLQNILPDLAAFGDEKANMFKESDIIHCTLRKC